MRGIARFSWLVGNQFEERDRAGCNDKDGEQHDGGDKSDPQYVRKPGLGAQVILFSPYCR
jgi:hypothetical protein